MLVSKPLLQRTIKALQRFDSAGSPFVGLQFGETAPMFHRSGANGIIESLGYDPSRPALVVSLGHLAATAARTVAEEVDLRRDANGILTLTGTTESDMEELRVYTVRQNVAWAKTHDLGEAATEIDPAGFQGINTSPFELASPPVLRRSKLMLATHFGIVMRNEVPVEAFPYPREGFLRSVSNLSVEKLYLTRGGYWGAIAGDLRVVVAGHRLGDQLFDTYSVGAHAVTEFPAERLLYALRQASEIAAEKSLITLDPSSGVIVSDQYSNLNRYTVASSGQWTAFSLLPKTAKLISDALSQTKEETVLLGRVDDRMLRMSRGPWEATFQERSAR